MNTPSRISSLILCLFFIAGSINAQDSFPRWTHFRGSNLDGISSEAGLPLSWNDSAIEKDFVYLHFGRYGTACLSSQTGETIWERTDMQCEHVLGSGSSLLIYKDKLIVHMEGTDTRYIYALIKQTGETIWRIERPEELYEHMDDKGKRDTELLAVDPKGAVDGLLYTVDTKALLSCIDTQNGTTVWSEKLKGKYNSSPVYADGYIYINSTRGQTLVYKAGRTLNRVSESKLEGEIWSTPAFTGGAILLRTDKYLYKIGKA